MDIDGSKEILLNGDKKVKVEKGFVEKIRSFWKRIFQHKENQKTMGLLERIGVKIKKFITDKQNKKELKEEINLIKNNIEELSSLIEKLKTKEQKEEINNIVDEFEEKKQSILNRLDEMLESDEIEGKDKIEALRKKALENESLIQKAKNAAMSKIKKQKTDDTVKGVIKQVKVVKPSNLVQTMSSIEDDAPTSVPTVEPQVEEKTKDPDIAGQDGKKKIEVEKDMENEKKLPITPKKEEIDSIDLSDLTQFLSYTDYLTAYRQARIDDKDSDKFYADVYNKNLPSDLLDEISFIKEKKRQEEELKQRKIETRKAEVEKKLAEEKAKHAEASEKVAELQSSIKLSEEKLKTERKKVVELEQEKVDAESKIADLERENANLNEQLVAAQEVAKKAQTQSYNDREKLAETEKELAHNREELERLKQELQESKGREAEINKKLEETNAKINKNIELAKKQISSLKDYDDLEKTALSWTIIGPEKAQTKEETPAPEMPKPEEPKKVEITTEVPQIKEPIPAPIAEEEPLGEVPAKGEDFVKAIEKEANEPEVQPQPIFTASPNGADPEKIERALEGVVAEEAMGNSKIR